MNPEEAKDILLLYRPGTADATDPSIAQALALVKQDAELARWFDEWCATREVLRAKFRQIPVPAGLKEQIISEQMAREKIVIWRRNLACAAAAAAVVAMLALTVFRFRPAADDNTLAVFRSRMAGVALRGYSMDLVANNPASIRTYFKQHNAPADYVLPAALQKVAIAGCAVESWQGTKVSMICFHTGKPLPPGEQSDLWLFVADRASIKDPPSAGPPDWARANQLVTAAWIRDGQLYLLGTKGDPQTLRRFL